MVERLQDALVQYFQQQRQIHRFEEVTGSAGFYRLDPGSNVATIGQKKQGNISGQYLPQAGNLLQGSLTVGGVIQINQQRNRLPGLRQQRVRLGQIRRAQNLIAAPLFELVRQVAGRFGRHQPQRRRPGLG